MPPSLPKPKIVGVSRYKPQTATTTTPNPPTAPGIVGVSRYKPTQATPQPLAPPSASQAFAREATLSAVPTGVGFWGGAKGGALAASKLPIPHPVLKTAAVLGTGLVSGIGASIAANKAQQEALPYVIGEENATRIEDKRAAAMETNPIAARAGQFASGLPLMGASVKNVLDAGRFLKNVISPKPNVPPILRTPGGMAGMDNAVNVVAGGATQGGTELYEQVKAGDINVPALLANFAAGSVFNKPTRLGRAVGIPATTEADYGRTLPVQSQTPESTPVNLTKPRQLPVKSETTEPTSVPVSTPNKRQAAYAEKMGYEPVTPDSELPVIKMGTTPKTKAEGVDIDEIEPPQVGGKSLNERMSNLAPEQRAEVISDARSLFGRGYEWDVARERALGRFENRQGESRTIVPENQPAPKPPVIDTPAKPNAAIPREPKLPTGQAPVTRTLSVKEVKSPTPALAARPEPISRPTPPAKPAATKKLPVKAAPVTKSVPVKTKVPPVKRPVTTPVKRDSEVRVSRYAARMQKQLKNVPKENVEEFADKYDLPTYNKMNRKEELEKAARIVENDEAEALRLFRTGQDAPDGTSHVAIGLALRTKATETGDRALAETLTSLRATRAGQDISLLAESDPNDPFRALGDIANARKKKAERDLPKGRTVEQEIRDQRKGAKSAVDSARLKIDEADDLLKSLEC